jgi:hypothetical protein
VQAPSAAVNDTFQAEMQRAAELAQHQPPLPPRSWYSDPAPLEATPPAAYVPGNSGKFSGPCRESASNRVLMTCPADWTNLSVLRYIEKSFRHLQVRVYRVIVRSLPSPAAGGCGCGWSVADIWLHKKMGALRAAEAIDAMLCSPPYLAQGCGLPIRFLAANTQLDYERSAPAAASRSAEACAANSCNSVAGSTQAAGTSRGSRSAKKKRPVGGALPHAAAATAAVAGAETVPTATKAAIAAGEDLELLRFLPYGYAL